MEQHCLFETKVSNRVHAFKLRFNRNLSVLLPSKVELETGTFGDRPIKVKHLWWWATFFGKFPLGMKRSVDILTEISEMARPKAPITWYNNCFFCHIFFVSNLSYRYERTHNCFSNDWKILWSSVFLQHLPVQHWTVSDHCKVRHALRLSNYHIPSHKRVQPLSIDLMSNTLAALHAVAQQQVGRNSLSGRVYIIDHYENKRMWTLKDQDLNMQTHRTRYYMLRVAFNCVAGGIALHGILSLGRSREGIFVKKLQHSTY